MSKNERVFGASEGSKEDAGRTTTKRFIDAMHFKESDWERYLHGPYFEGDIHSGAILMRQLVDGMRWRYNRASDLNADSSNLPNPFVDTGDTGRHGFGIVYLPLFDTIQLGTRLLETLSGFPEDQIIVFTRGDSSLAFRGKPVEFAFLSGVEEYDHILFGVTRGLHPDTVSRGEYNAQEHEYRSLIIRREAALELGFSEQCVAILNDMISEADVFRHV